MPRQQRYHRRPRRISRAQIIDAIARNLNLAACAALLRMDPAKLQDRLDRRGITREWADVSIPVIVDRHHDRRRYNGLIPARRAGAHQ
jgi:hypothetical protein